MPKFRVVAALKRRDYPLEIERERFSGLDCELNSYLAKDEEDTVKFCSDAHIILTPVGGGVFSGEVLDRLGDCLAIIRYGVGLDSIDVARATELGIIVSHVPDFCVDEVSTHTITLILSCWRRLFHLCASVKEGNWSYHPYRPIYRLAGKTLGLVSFGRVARSVAQKAKPWGLRIAAYDPYVDSEEMEALGVVPLSLEELLRVSHIVSIHVPATHETYHMIGEKELAMMRPEAVLINTSRGSVVDEVALYKALISGQIRGAGLDVLEKEPPDFPHPLSSLDNVMITPHCSYYSEESLYELHSRVAEAAVDIMKGRVPTHTVNKDLIGEFRLFRRRVGDG